MSQLSWLHGQKRVDATKRVTINIRKQDIVDATERDGEQCVAARCTLRALAANRVYFYRSVCYVQWDEGDVVERYFASGPLRKNVILVLDDDTRSNSEIIPGRYELLPPPVTQRLGVKRNTGKTGKTRPAAGSNRKAVAYSRIATAKGK